MALPGERKPEQKPVPSSEEKKPVLQEKPRPTSSRTSKQAKRTRGGGKAKSGAQFTDLAKLFGDLYIQGSELAFLPTGSINADKLLGGGLPRGRISEWMSPAGVGKSTLALWACVTNCIEGRRSVYIDTEYAVNDSLLEGVGLDRFRDDLFFLVKLQTFSQAEEVIDGFLASSEIPDIFVMDSITALTSTKLQEGGMKIEDAEPGWQARLLSNFFLKYKGKFGQAGAHLMCINQMRVKLSFKGPSGMDGGGGNPMKFYPDIRVKMINGGDIIESGNKIGSDVGMETIKNKVTMPFQKNVVSIMFGKGVSNIRACTFLLEAEGIVTQSGAFFMIDFPGIPKKTVQGRMALSNFISENEEIIVSFLRQKGRL